MKKRNILAGVLAASLAMSAFSGVSVSAAEETTGLFTDEIEENAKITYWEMQWGSGDYEGIVNKLVDRFNEENEYGIEVEVQIIPWDGYYETFLTAVTSGAAPDCATGPSANPIQYAVMGESLNLQPIMDAWEAEGNPILDEIEDYMWQFYKYEGDQYGIPFGIDPKGILYRSDFFEEAGITELPTTYDELIETARTLKEKFPDKIPVLIAAGDQVGGHMACVLNGCNNVGFTTADLQADMTSQGQLENLQFIKTMYDEGLVSPGSAGYMDADLQKIWLAGEACIVIGCSGNFCEGTEIEAVSRLMPNVAGPSATAPKYAACINGINGFSQTEYPNATRYFIKWWSENNKELMVDGKQGNFPVRSSYYEDPYYSESVWRMDSYKYEIENGQTVVYPCESLYSQFAQLEGEQVIGSAYTAVLTGKDVQEAAEEANAEIQKVIDEYAAE